MRTDRLLGEMGLAQDSPAGRRQFELRMEERRAQETGGDWKAIRRGWCFGDETFRKELLAQMTERGENIITAKNRARARRKMRNGSCAVKWTRRDGPRKI